MSRGERNSVSLLRQLFAVPADQTGLFQSHIPTPYPVIPFLVRQCDALCYILSPDQRRVGGTPGGRPPAGGVPGPRADPMGGARGGCDGGRKATGPTGRGVLTPVHRTAGL